MTQIIPTDSLKERADKEKIAEQVKYFFNSSFMMHFIDAIPIPVMILNRHRQVVYSNSSLQEITGKQGVSFFYGKRPGEILSCSHAFETPAGCGTTESCTTCGALNAILATLDGTPAVKETRILRSNNEALDLRVYSSPLKMENEQFTIFAIMDVSDEKRRLNLERIFFHDLLNTASSVKALAYGLENAKGKDTEEFRTHLASLSDKLVEEICAQRDIYAAENNELAVYLSRANTFILMNDVFAQFSFDSKDVKIVLDNDSDNCDFLTDKVLTRRILTNMVKNAVEASTEGSIVRMSCIKEDGYVKFSVHNPGYIPRDIQLQIFQRSFSTKGFGRGAGTYSMKLLTENYLKGKVFFKSTEEEGTTFFCRLPLNLD